MQVHTVRYGIRKNDTKITAKKTTTGDVWELSIDALLQSSSKTSVYKNEIIHLACIRKLAKNKETFPRKQNTRTQRTGSKTGQSETKRSLSRYLLHRTTISAWKRWAWLRRRWLFWSHDSLAAQYGCYPLANQLLCLAGAHRFEETHSIASGDELAWNRGGRDI